MSTYASHEAKSVSDYARAINRVRSGLLQRKCACGGTPGSTGECESCRKKRLQRKSKSSALESQNDVDVPSIVHEVLRSPGQPLEPATRAFMEPRFGHDFGNVRVHHDSRAAESAQAINARAYTVGRNVVFGDGAYAPHTSPGQRLLAHELTHVLQQRCASNFVHWPLAVDRVDSNAEQEAEREARRTSFHGCPPARSNQVALQRQVTPALPATLALPMSNDDEANLQAAQLIRATSLVRATNELLDLERAVQRIGSRRVSDPAQYQLLWQAYPRTIWPVIRWLKVESGVDTTGEKDNFLLALIKARFDLLANLRTDAPVEKVDNESGTCSIDPSIQGFADAGRVHVCARVFAGNSGALALVVMHEIFHLLGHRHGGELQLPGIDACDLSQTPAAAGENPYCLTGLAFDLAGASGPFAARTLPSASMPTAQSGSGPAP
jgi:uncharacterized protein DUF4157